MQDFRVEMGIILFEKTSKQSVCSLETKVENDSLMLNMFVCLF